MKTSMEIKTFLDWMTSCEEEYEQCKQVVETENKRLQDFLHYIEFEEHSSERSKECTRFRIHRHERREAKNRIEILEPLVTMFRDKSFSRYRNQLTQLLGQTRKIEKKQTERKYKPRVEREDIK